MGGLFKPLVEGATDQWRLATRLIRSTPPYIPVINVEALESDLDDDIVIRQQDGVAVGAEQIPSLFRPGPGVARKFPVQVVGTYARPT